MKRLLPIMCALLFILALNSFATDTRVLTVGDNNNVLLDEANIWLYPSRIVDYPNLAIGEFSRAGRGSDDFTDLGIHWKLDRERPRVLGTYFSVLPTYYPSDLFGGNLIPFDSSLQDNRRIDLFYGDQWGTNNVGLHFGFLHSSRTADYTGNQYKESFAYYNVTAGITPTSGLWDLSGNIGVGAWTDQDSNGDTETDKDAFLDLSVKGRGFWQLNPDYTIIPHAGIYYSNRGVKNYMIDTIGAVNPLASLDLTEKNKLTVIDLGTGINYTPATNVLGVADFGFMYAKQKRENDTTTSYGGPILPNEETITTWFFPYFKIGLDADIFRWLDLLVGATSYWTSETHEIKNLSKMNKRFPDNATYLGFGFHWGRLHVDTYTDPDLFLKGLNFISGSRTDMNWRISAVYEMM